MVDTRFKKGDPKKGGRKKGTPNKTSDAVKKAILKAFDPIQFEAWVKENPGLFFSKVLTKVLPKDVKTDMDGSVTFRFEGWKKPHG